MELPKTPEGNVTQLAVVRALRNVTRETLARDLGIPAVQVLWWECGEKPSPAVAKRLGLRLRWEWTKFMSEPMAYEDGWATLVKGRKSMAKIREG